MTFIIANPAAGRGKASGILRELEATHRHDWASKLLVTERPGDEARLTRAALRQGAKVIVVIGGDGTFSKVAQEILAAGEDCALAVIPSGTGDDIAKTLGVYGATPAEVLLLAGHGTTTRMDVGRADGRYFLNSCGFGFDSSVLQATQRVRFLKGNALYIYSALAQLFSYKGVDVAIDGAGTPSNQKVLMAVASNGRSLGGAFRIAPGASVTDGKLDLCLISDTDVMGRARIFANAFRGTHLGLPGVSSVRTDSVSLTFPVNPAMEMDGELRLATSTTVRIECVPRSLSVIASPGALL